MIEGRTPQDVVFALTDADGACRDINWFGLSTDGAVALLRWIGDRYTITALHETKDDEAVPCDVESGCEALVAGRSVHGYFEQGPPEVSQIQFCSYREPEETEWFVELTFFPQDVALERGLVGFLRLIEKAKVECAASAYFVRYENASFDPAWEKRGHREVVYASDDVPELLLAATRDTEGSQ